MKRVKSVVVARPVKVVQNTVKSGNQWGRITDANTGEILHTGQLGYIRRVARQRYNVAVKFN